jgi:hypothetical protein
MADQEWSKNAIFDPALVRRVVEEQIHVEKPADIAIGRATSPPVPGLEQRAILADPQIVELWQQIAVEAPRDTPQADPPPNDAATVAQMSMALYFLHALHTQDKPGHEHLPRDERKQPGQDEDDDLDAKAT